MYDLCAMLLLVHNVLRCSSLAVNKEWEDWTIKYSKVYDNQV